MRRFGLSEPQLLALWSAMRGAHITDADIARVFGCSRQNIHNRLGARPDHWSEREWEMAQDLARQGHPMAYIARTLNLTDRTTRELVLALGYTPERLKSIRQMAKRQQVAQELLQYLEQGLPLTSVCLARWDRQKPFSTLLSRATRIQSLADWRHELGVEETTPLHVAHVIHK